MDQPIDPPRQRWILEALSLLTPFDVPEMRKIRVGVDEDGGYVMFDDFANASIVYSFGIGFSISFDRQLAEMGKEIFMFDHTIQGLPSSHQNFNFYKQGIGATNQPEASLFTLDYQIEQLGHGDRDDMVLKIDVEGAEFDAISTMSVETLSQFRQFVLEVHWLSQLSDEAYARKFIEVFKKINSVFTLFHAHANNCAPVLFVEGYPLADVLELSYIRSDLISPVSSKTVYPTKLDYANRIGSRDHLLWFYPFLPTSYPSEGPSLEYSANVSREAADQSIYIQQRFQLKQRLVAAEKETAYLRDELEKLLSST